MLAGLWWVDWFTFTASLDKAHVASIDLRGIHICAVNGPCIDMSMQMLRGSYATMATIAFWTSIAFGIAVAFQLAMQVVAGQVLPQLSRIGYLVAFAAIAATLTAAYVLGPEPEHAQGANGTITVARHAGPLVLLAGLALGAAALIWLDRAAEADAAPPATAHVGETRFVPRVSSLPVVPEVAPRVGPPFSLDHTAATLDLSPAGLDARLDGGSLCMVAWTDVVGVVARRLPAAAPYEGAIFVDLISKPGATVRVVPWTKLVGLPPGDTGVDRARAVIAAVIRCHPAAKLDAATRACIDDGQLPRQLADAAELAEHNRRLP